MEREVMSSRSGSSLLKPRKSMEYQVPEHFYVEYFKKLDSNGPLYAILSVEGNDSRMFFAPYKGLKNEFVSYVFFREIDARKYLEALKISGYITSTSAVMWKCRATGLAASYKKLTEKESRKNSKARTFHVITSIFLHDQFHDIEYFWTDDRSNVN